MHVQTKDHPVITSFSLINFVVSEMKSDLLLFSNRVYVKLPLAMEINIDFSMDTRNQLFLLDSHKFGFKWSS